MAIPYKNSSISDASIVAHALAERAEDIGIALLGDPSSKSRREYRWGSHGSIALCLTGAKRGLWCDYERLEGGDLLHLIARALNLPLGRAIDVAKHEFLGPLSVAVRRTEAPRRVAKDDDARTAAAQRLWREATPIAGTLAERYFIEKRRLEISQLDVGHVLRWHPGNGAIIGLMTDPVSRAPLGVHRTFLDANGAKIERKMLGPQGVIRLSPDDAVTMSLGITEGVEDGIAILLSGWAPVWAATSAGAMARLPVLPGIEALTIFADADDAGMQSAQACRERWCSAGRDVVVSAPRGLTI